MRNLVARFRLKAAAALLLALAAGSAAVFAGAGPVAKAATTYKAFAGGGEASPAGGIAVEAFRPDQIRIHAGDTIQWTNPYEEIHTVTFVPANQAKPPLIAGGDINPVVAAPTQQTAFDATKYTNSGILAKGQSFSLTFPNQGAFQFYCVLHPGMIVNVFVVPDSVQVESQAQLDARAAQMLTEGIAAGRTSVNSTQAPANEVVNPASVGQVDLMYFVPQRINIPVGGTVTWRNRTAVPHTVTFNIQ
ncbi:MAG TPA: plastocyanin/azurin family copper-binding protein, partial [Dehalococcoidia bacterium]|nr:plastocyanin/azurin family copper-binding protein [Dehalococcoidia bacterium]